MDNPKVNDGKGLWDNVGICDQATVICNTAIKELVSGEYINFCNCIYQVAKILQNLKTGITEERKSYEEKIEDLKRMNDNLVEQTTGLPVIRGEERGEN